MERAISQEERIKRAQELYYNRRERLAKTTTVNVTPKKNYSLLKKVIIQILISAGIYIVIYNMIGSTDNFSIDSIKYLKETIGYDINFNKAYENISNYISGIIPKNKNENASEGDQEIAEETLGVSENEENIEENGENINQENITAQEEVKEVTEEASSISQMEQDAEYIKANFSLIKPVEGPISSRFGLRNPTTATVPKYHTGIDIAVAEGTVYVSAMDGTVELVSSVGDYR